VHSFPGVESVTRTSYGLSTIRRLRIPRDDFIITSIGEEGRFAGHRLEQLQLETSDELDAVLIDTQIQLPMLQPLRIGSPRRLLDPDRPWIWPRHLKGPWGERNKKGGKGLERAEGHICLEFGGGTIAGAITGAIARRGRSRALRSHVVMRRLRQVERDAVAVERLDKLVLETP